METKEILKWIEKRSKLIGVCIANIEDGYEIGEPKQPKKIAILTARLDIIQELENEILDK